MRVRLGMMVELAFRSGSIFPALFPALSLRNVYVMVVATVTIS